MPSRTNPGAKALDSLAAVIQGFDYKVDLDDFLLYELGRLIEEDRASFDDEEFRHIVDEGIREYIEERLEARAQLSGQFRLALSRMVPQTAAIASRVIHALEDAEAELRNVGVIVRSYTAYLFEELQAAGDRAAREAAPENEARALIEVWRQESLPGEPLVPRLVGLGRLAVAPVADLLFDFPEDRRTAGIAIEVLGQIRSTVSARVLAHAISEPVFEEDLEEKAYRALANLWPLPRHYMLYTLRRHTHEDLPFRWFKLLVESDDISAVDQILEELRMHNQSAAFQEDLAVLMELLLKSRDPETKEKVLDLLNDAETPKHISARLTTFLKTYPEPPPLAAASNPWTRRARLIETNRHYLKAARLSDSGKTAEAIRALDDILARDPGEPLSLMLRRILLVECMDQSQKRS